MNTEVITKLKPEEIRLDVSILMIISLAATYIILRWLYSNKRKYRMSAGIYLATPILVGSFVAALLSLIYNFIIKNF